VTLTRKDFFRQGFFSLGNALLKAGATAAEAQGPPGCQPDDEEQESAPVSDANTVARADNRHCLAKSCGCFSCVDRCEPGAVMLIPGTGIRIDEERCTGCGTCEYICPVTPKAVRMQARTSTTIHTPSADHAAQPPQKGVSTC
jgi:ferredoxin